MNNDTDSAIMRSVSKPNGGIDRVQVVMALFLLGLLLVACPSLVLAVYWLEFEDNPPASVENIVLFNGVRGEVVDEILVSPGGQIAFSVDFCKFTNSAASIRRTWLNELVYHATVEIEHPGISEEHPVVLQPGCGTQLVVLDVPTTLPPEEYTLGNTITYRVNPLKERFISYDVGPIIVKEP